jgi:hypothetical protein
MHRLLAATALLVPYPCLGQSAPAPASVPVECAQFLGSWSGEWSKGVYGTQWIHVTAVSEQCLANVAYSAWSAVPPATRPIPIDGGVMVFPCNAATGGTCRLEIKGTELLATYTDPSGFMNSGVFRKDR